MEIIIHRVNTRSQLEKVPSEYGAEVDLRAAGGKIILHHDAHVEGEEFEGWLSEYGSRGTLVLNIKESGIEDEVLDMVRAARVNSYFLLDIEFPYLYSASRRGVTEMAVRYSEAEPIESALVFENQVDWVWIDTNTRLPISNEVKGSLEKFKTCLVCPERWGRPDDIETYREKVRDVGFRLDAVMTALDCVNEWTK